MQRPDSEPALRSVSFQLAVHPVESLGSGGAPSAGGYRLTRLELELSEVEAIDCAEQSVVTAFHQKDAWDSGNPEEAELPEGGLCRLIVRAMALEKGGTPEATPGAYISGDSSEGPFKLLAPAPIGGFLEVLDPELDLTTVADLRLEVSEERLLAEIQLLLVNSRSSLLQPGSPETLQLSRALGSSLDLVAGVGAARRVLASAAQEPNDSLCADYCGSYERALCSGSCDLAVCEDTRVDAACGPAFEAWLSCINRTPSDRLVCDNELPEDIDSICGASRAAFEACQQGGAP